MRRVSRLWTIAFLTCALLVPPPSAKADECGCNLSTSHINPIFKHLNEVVIVVQIWPSTFAYKGKDKQLTLPEPLRTENLEAMLQALYTKRLSKPACMGIPNCYNKENQPVRVMSAESPQERQKIVEAVSHPGTLLVFLNGYFQEARPRNYQRNDLLFVMSLTNHREGLTSSIFDEQLMPLAFVVDGADPSILAKGIEHYIWGYIAE